MTARKGGRDPKTFRFEWRVPAPRSKTRFGPGQIKRPGAYSQLGRPLGLTAVLVAYIALLEQQLPYAILFVALGLAGIVVWAVRKPGAEFMATFPYEYVGDLAERPPDAAISRTMRLGLTLLLGIPVLVAWMVLLGWTRDGAAISIVPAVLTVIWAYEATEWPEPSRIRIALIVGAAVGVPIGALGILMTTASEAAAGALASGVTVAAIATVGLTLHQVGRRSPDRLI
ncbi:MAG: hypothetical protein ABR575_07100 [Actinomycetota bacterium]